VRAEARAVVEAADDGRLIYRVLRSAAPLLLRPAANGLYLVGGAGGPLAGDEVSLDLEVGPGAELVLRTVAASVGRPGAPVRAAGQASPDGRAVDAGPDAPDDGPWSRFTVTARVAAGASLRWLPEPGVASTGCRHVVISRLDLDDGATVIWRDEVVLGRHGEDAGAWSSSLSADLAAAPFLRHCLTVGPGAPAWDGPAIAGRARAVGSMLVVEPSWGSGPPPLGGPQGEAAGDRVVMLALPGPGILVSALATTALGLRRLLDQALAQSISGRPLALGS